MSVPKIKAYMNAEVSRAVSSEGLHIWEGNRRNTIKAERKQQGRIRQRLHRQMTLRKS